MASPAFLVNLLEQLQDHLPQLIAHLRETEGMAPVTPVKTGFQAVEPPAAPKKAVSKVSKTTGAEPLEDVLLNAMLKAGIKPGAHAKVLADKVFTPEGIPEELHADARVQWKKWRADVSDEDASAAEAESVLSPECLAALKEHGGFYAGSQVRKLAPEFLALDIPHVLHEKASKEWRAYAETERLTKKPDSPKAPRAPRAPKVPVVVEPVLTEELKASLKEAGFHQGSQMRKMSETLAGLGVEEELHAQAAKEWRDYAKAEGLVKEDSAKSSPKVKPAKATKEVPAFPTAAVAATPEVILTTARMAMLKEYGTPSNAGLNTLDQWFAVWGIPEDKRPVAAAQWHKWAHANEVPAEEEKNYTDAVAASGAGEEDVELDL
jgi:hypothetical protein